MDYEVVKLRIYPTLLQEQRCDSWLETLRWLYNSSLAQRKDAYHADKTTITHRQQRDALPLLKKQHPHLKYLPSWLLQDCLVRLQGAFDHFFRRVRENKQGAKLKVGYARFKKYGSYRSFTYTQVWMTQKGTKREVLKLRLPPEAQKKGEEGFIKVNALLVLPKLGEVKVRLHRPIDWELAKTVTIKKMPSGQWYACVCLAVQSERPDPKKSSRRAGVDVGLRALVTTSDGVQFEHPRALGKSEEKLKREQRKLSKKQKGSYGWESQRKRVAKVHQKIVNQRRDFLHKLALWLVLSYGELVFEDLDIGGMVRERRFAKSILDAGWGTLMAFVTYKSVKLGGKVWKVDPRYTSQDCSRCGHRVPKTLAERMHNCPNCGLLMDRDQNAAVNLKKRVGMGRPDSSGFP